MAMKTNPRRPDRLPCSMTSRLALLALLCTAAVARPAAAQELRPNDVRVSTSPGYFTYFLPGERTSQVTVLGTVRAPGLYLVSAGTTLGELLGLAGGPYAGPVSNEVERTTTIRLYRATDGGTREVIYERTDDAFARDANAYPVVLDGDTVEVTTTERRLRTYRDTLTLVGSIAGIAVVILQVITLTR